MNNIGLNPRWLGYIASGPEALASGCPKTWKKWTHNSLCPEKSVSGAAWTLVEKPCTEHELLCITAFGSCYFPISCLPRQEHQLPIRPLRSLSLLSHSLGPLCFYFFLLTCSSFPLVLLVWFNSAWFPQDPDVQQCWGDQWSVLLSTLFLKGGRTGCSEEFKSSAKMWIEIMTLPFHVALGLLWCSFCLYRSLLRMKKVI